MIFSNRKRILSAFLSLTMIGSMVASVPFTASAATAKATSVSFSVFENNAWKNSSKGIAGSANKGYKVSALKASLTNAPKGASISYSLYEGKKWITATSGKVAGTAKKKTAVYAAEFKATLKNASAYSISYSIYENKKWISGKNGAVVGKAGKKIEAVKISITKKAVAAVTVKKVSDVDDLNVDNGTDVDTAINLLPTTVDVTLSNGKTVSDVDVTWTADASYSATTAGTYAFTGKLATISGVKNTSGVTASANVIVGAVAITVKSVADTAVTTTVGAAPTLPATVTATYTDASTKDVAVTWEAIDASKYAAAGTFTVSGTIADSDVKATATVTVTAPTVVSVEAADVTTAAGVDPSDALPDSVTATFSDGTSDDVAVTWDEISDASSYATAGQTFTVNGTIAGTTVKATAKVTVTAAIVSSIDEVSITTFAGTAPELPATVTATLSNDTTAEVAVSWNEIDASDYATADAKFTVNGIIDNSEVVATATVTVNAVPTIDSVTEIDVSSPAGENPTYLLDDNVIATYSDGTTDSVAVSWDTITEDQYATPGSFVLNGTIAGTELKAVANVTITDAEITDIPAITATTQAGVAPTLPEVVKATYSDGSVKNVAVTWDPIDASSYASAGPTFAVSGTVYGTEYLATANVTVTVNQAAIDAAAAATVDATIAALPATVTLDDETAVVAARTAFTALTTAQQALVTKISVLTADEKTIADLKAAAAQLVIDKAAAATVDATIAALPAAASIALTDAATVTAARTAYDALTATQQGLVTGLDTLKADEAAIKVLTDAATQAAADIAAAKGVDDLITALPATVTLTDEANVVAARAAYTALTATQQGLVTGLATLTADEATITALNATVSSVANLVASNSTLNIGDTTTFGFTDSANVAVVLPATTSVTYAVTSLNFATAFLNNGVFTATAAGTYEITATIGTKTFKTTVDVIGVAASVNLSAATSSVSVTGSATDKITATVVDANGKTVTSFNGTVYAYLNPVSNGTLTEADGTTKSAGTLASPIAYTAVNGVVTFTVNTSTTKGNDVVVVAVKDSTGAYGTWKTVSVTVTDAAATSIGIAANTPTTLANTSTIVASGYDLTFNVLDQSGNAVANGPYNGTVTITGPAVFANGTQTTALSVGSSGIATTKIYTTSATATGTITVTPNVIGLTSVPYTLTLYTPGTASKLALTTAPTTTSFTADKVYGTANFLTYPIQIQDANGYATVTNAPTSIASAVVTYNGATSTAISATISGFNVNLNQISTTIPTGTYTVTITPVAGADGTTLPAITETFTVTAGAASTVAVTPSAVTSLTTTANSSTISAQLMDAEGNKVTTAGVIIDFAAVAGTHESNTAKLANGTNITAQAPSISATQVSTNASGIATITATEGTAGAATAGQAGYVTAKIDPTGSTVNSGYLYIVGSTTTKVTTTSTATTYTAGSTTYPVITAYSQTTAGVLTSDVIDFTLTKPDASTVTGSISNTGTVGFGASTSTLTGTSAVTIAAPTAVGTYTFTFTDISAPGAPSSTVTITVVAGTANKVTIFNNGSAISSYTTTASTAGTIIPLTVSVTDASGNIVTSSNAVTVALTNDHGTLSLTQGGIPTQTVTIPAGATSATVYFVDGNTAGETTAFTATSTAAAATATFSTFSTVSTTTPYDYTGYVTIKDQYGNAVSGLTFANFAAKSSVVNTPDITYTGIATIATGDFTVSEVGATGVYLVTVRSASSLKGATLTITTGSATSAQVLAN